MGRRSESNKQMTEQTNIIDDFLNKYEPKLSQKTKAMLKPLMSIQQLPKKKVLIRENQVNSQLYLMLQGAARSFFLRQGVEVHTWFAFENEVLGSLRNFGSLPARETVELLEDSLLIAFDSYGIKALMKDQVEVANFVNASLIEYALYLEDKLFYTQLRSAKERFDNLLAHEPEIFQRVPLTYIASYLGISRETLSRLRAK